MKILLTYFLFFIAFFPALAQTFRPDLHQSGTWEVTNRKVDNFMEGQKKAVRFNHTEEEGFMLIKDYQFTGGTIEFDVKGKNVPQQSFVGVTFHRQDLKHYDVVYFRPFNFVNADTLRRPRSVQYASMPDYPWEKLRANSPGRYENKVTPVPDPDGWFHVRITVLGKSIKVYVDHSATPSLEVESLSKFTTGKIGLWAGPMSDPSFANLEITPSEPGVPYGNNPQAGHYVHVGDARLYYEIYGQGEPLVLLHGGVYGYIDEFAPFIERFSKTHQVICIATRGHGRSEMGAAPFTWQQRAEDAYRVIRAVTRDSVSVLGFSDGGYTGYKLAANHPELVKKLVVIGAGDRPKNRKVVSSNYTPELLLGQSREYFERKLAIMPEPKRWGECLARLNALYDQDFLSTETFSKIKCRTLIMTGDRDRGHGVEQANAVYKAISGSQLSIIPACSHVVFHCNFPAVWESVRPFLQ